MWPDYNLENPSSWTIMDAPSLDRQWERDLARIGGLNPFGAPMLMVRWGATYKDPMSLDHGLKYWIGSRDRELEGFMFTCPVTGMELLVKKMDDVPPSVLVAVPKYSEAIDLGERRWIVEIWRSAEFLARSGRYTEAMTRDNGQSTDYVFCRNCHTELAQDADTDKPCANCGSSRTYIKTEREEGDGRLLQTGAPQGAYDFFMRLENALGQPMEADGQALKLVEHLWRDTKKSRKEKLTDMLLETDSQRASNAAATSPVNPFQSPTVQGW